MSTETSLTADQASRSQRWLKALRTAIRRALPRASEKAPEAKLSERVTRNLLAYGWAITYHRLLVVVSILLLLINVIIWVGNFTLSHRPAYIVRSPGSLSERATAYFQINGANYDELSFFLNSVLSIKNTLTPDGNPMLPLLKGIISPDLYREQELKLINANEALKVNFLTQSLVVTEVKNILVDEKTSRVGAYVSGFLVITVRNGKGGHDATTMPYRALCAVETQPISELSPYPFHLVECREKVDKAALDWDATNRK